MTQISPAATTLIIREIKDDIEVLLLKRSSNLAFAPDFWVFPGGRIDAEDGSLESEHILATAKVAAARESMEEANIKVSPDDMHHYCHWTTPSGGNRRFATWFFHCKAPKKDIIKVDDSEIVDHLWIRPQDALAEMSHGNLGLLPPTFISLERIKSLKTYDDAKTEYDRTGIVTATPNTTIIDGIFYCLYEGDAGYATTDVDLTESKHRLIVDQKKGKYHFEYQDCDLPPINGGVF